ncbi:MAG: uracil-DNA glycosylase [Gammaproteobacteria bacterium]|nr:uracil-DNA glycosylase [Gammaproteobacteria bacterium]
MWVRRGVPARQADVPVEVEAPAAAKAETPVAKSPSTVEIQNIPDVSTLDWTALKDKVRDCTACKLRAGCTQTVFGVGDEQADWLFVGEGPGADEDAQGEPFVGQAGKLLDNMLFAIGLKRGDNVYIANVVKCRPPNNRNPEADEIATCLPYLQQQIALIKPKLIVALGKTAATALLERDATLGSLRGTTHDFHGTPLLVTYHPAYLLRSPAEKAKAWQDLKFAVALLR